MPTTPSGLRYPSADGHSNTWLYWQQLAEDIDRVAKTTVANETARLALVSPAEGLLVVEKDTKRIYLRTATGWELVWQPRVSYASRSLCIVQRNTQSIPAGGAWTRVTGWTTEQASAAFSVNTGTGIITCARDGLLSISGYAFSDDTVPGRSGIRVRVPGGASAFPLEHLYDNRYRGGSTAFGSAGNMRQPWSWSGRIQAGETTYVDAQQENSDDGSIPYNVYFALEYLTDY